MIISNEHNFYVYWNLNTISWPKMLNIGFKGTTTQNYDFNVTTMKLVDGIMCAVWWRLMSFMT